MAIVKFEEYCHINENAIVENPLKELFDEYETTNLSVGDLVTNKFLIKQFDNMNLKKIDKENNSGELDSEDTPFNPNNIEIQTPPFNLGYLFDKLEHDEIVFQNSKKTSKLWDDAEKSQLIESVFLRLSLPTFYFESDNDNHWIVVDGAQRIDALNSFCVEKTLKLQDLQFYKNFNGLTYDELPREMQRRMITFPITVVVIGKGTAKNIKNSFYNRINH